MPTSETVAPLLSAGSRSVLLAAPGNAVVEWQPNRILGDVSSGRLSMRPGRLLIPKRPEVDDTGPSDFVFGVLEAPAVFVGPKSSRRLEPGAIWMMGNDTNGQLMVEVATRARFAFVGRSRLGNTRLGASGFHDLAGSLAAGVVRLALRTLTADGAAVGNGRPGVIDAHDSLAFIVGHVSARARRGAPVTEESRLAIGLRYIDANLTQPSLSTDQVARELHMSRRAIQVLFKDHGGVATYIRRRRLKLALDALAASTERKPALDEIARMSGLGTKRTLERVIRSELGMTLGQVRTRMLNGDPS